MMELRISRLRFMYVVLYPGFKKKEVYRIGKESAFCIRD
jgi:hypothetical protein